MARRYRSYGRSNANRSSTCRERFPWPRLARQLDISRNRRVWIAKYEAGELDERRCRGICWRLARFERKVSWLWRTTC